MALKSLMAKAYAAYINKKNSRWINNGLLAQENVLTYLLAKAQDTAYGKHHNFKDIITYDDFKRAVPVADYELLKPWIERVRGGEGNVLWPGKPEYLAKTSGTTSGVKYIPLTRQSLKAQVNAARDALLAYIHESGNADFVDGKMIFLQGSPALEFKNGIGVGRLSGIVAHYVPAYLQKNRLPGMETNLIEDWELKVDTIVEETLHEDMRLISGIPPWVQMYNDKLIKKAGGRPVGEIFKNLSLLVYGGVNYEPYRLKMERSFGRRVDSIETYPASEGFIAYQNKQGDDSLLLLLDGGIFYEFIEAADYYKDDARRISLHEVKTGVNYALILNTNAGLWGYSIGDTVMFTSLDPYKIKVTGRLGHFLSAFGEHVIGSEVEYALQNAAREFNIAVAEFHVAPQVNAADGGLPYHQWLVELVDAGADVNVLAERTDELLREKNTYYNDLREGNVLQRLKMDVLKPAAFSNFMKTNGRMDAQSKMVRLANDRKIADQLMAYIITQ